MFYHSKLMQMLQEYANKGSEKIGAEGQNYPAAENNY
jgi:hypothetical protein